MTAEDARLAVEAWRAGRASTPSKWAHTDGRALYRLATCVAVQRPGQPAVVNLHALGQTAEGVPSITLLQQLALRAYPDAVRVDRPAGASATDLLRCPDPDPAR